MDSQLKKGFLDVVVLASLMDEPSYGYRIVQDLQPLADLSESTLYPVLRRLEAQNLVNTYTVPHNGRLRRYYQITLVGKTRIKEFLDEWKDLYKIFSYISNKFRGRI